MKPILFSTDMVRRAFVNVYEGVDCRFLSDEDYGSYKDAYEGRDQLSSYVETIEIVRHTDREFLTLKTATYELE